MEETEIDDEYVVNVNGVRYINPTSLWNSDVQPLVEQIQNKVGDDYEIYAETYNRGGIAKQSAIHVIAKEADTDVCTFFQFIPYIDEDVYNDPRMNPVVEPEPETYYVDLLAIGCNPQKNVENYVNDVLK